MDEVKTSQLKKIISADVTVMLYQQGDYVMAYCPALELSSYGKTEQEATAAFREALDIFLEYCGEQGTLEQNLIACGWDIRQGYHQPEEVSVPIELLKSQQLHSFDQKIALSVY
jgi:predicted RNase H-like HicB family nuclease